ncbi:hypothetical protein [Paenibacillus tyrfis]|uniref:hypothetical protein n=1 Tax=Paenibacillus tyrfis TaxID=1501230 RepID=UPI00209E42F3|nr:hypothetical protein [Paenibacillus tyrfis]MCP1310539.1 hypothetical protein [Paenibacillus tyrfis]
MKRKNIQVKHKLAHFLSEEKFGMFILQAFSKNSMKIGGMLYGLAQVDRFPPFFYPGRNAWNAGYENKGGRTACQSGTE